MKNGNPVVGAFVVAVGLAACGAFIGNGFFKGRAADRVVTVKGLSERDVEADVALWPIRFVTTDDDLGKAQAEIKRSYEKVLAYLVKHDIEPAAATVQDLQVTDVLANAYRTGEPAGSRYIVSQTVMVRTNTPQTIRRASENVGELVEAGVVLSSQGGYGGGPTYMFTGLNDLKPAMIAEATAEARRAALQFAADSGSQIGKIRRANQGVFVILPRDRAPGITEGNQIQKTVRVVSTVEYTLKD